MFDDFYGLTAKPFQLTPDPDFYYPSHTHRRALSYLGYGLAQGEGFIVITGEIGAGKSTLVAHMMRGLDPALVTVAQVVTSKLDGEEIVHVIARAFGLPVDGHDKASALAEIEAFLHDEARGGRRALLVVDEAQNLDLGALEELRMLSNFQLGNHPLLQVLLLGQPEFRTTLQTEPRLEQLRQRVIAAHHLEPMHRSEIEPYITHRLETAGWGGNPAFDQRVFADLYEASGGIPRKVNQIANRLLLLGAVEERTRIDAAMLQAVLAEMDGECAFPEAAPASAPRPSAAPAPAAAFAPPPAAFAPPPAAPMAEPSRHAATGHPGHPGPAAGAVAGDPPAGAGLDPQLVADLLAERDEKIAELQQAVLELAQAQEEAAASALAAAGTEAEALRRQVAELEARTLEQERTIRQTLSMLIEWIESETDATKAA